jgi:ubiquinone/menaquinone biosynthesis C-methylase UbiE
MQLPRRENIQPTEIADPLKFYYLPLARRFYIKRLELVLSLFQKRKFETLLDVGCGSGIFLKELANHCHRLHALDTHRRMSRVREMTVKERIPVDLVEASVTDLPYRSGTFDCIVSVSVLEHVRELSKALMEIRRVARKGGLIVLGFPIENAVTDWFLKLGYVLLPKARLEEEHVTNHSDIIRAVRSLFKETRLRHYPSTLPLNFALYGVFKIIN